jgi:hypothetical protein
MRIWEDLDSQYEIKDCGYKTPCWLWKNARMANGYGVFRSGYKLHSAHRVFYTQTKGTIPKGLDLDHLCKIRHCVNPDHLEAVTRSINISRMKPRGCKFTKLVKELR